tara:strand:+ start:1831 stop:2415 length:585 start_codon:yes stop_codon:yes gene_type:complete
MNTLEKKANHNLNTLLNMGEDDIFISKRAELEKQDEFVQVNNIIDLEYAIYFTFHHHLNSQNNHAFYNDNLIHKLDMCIDNLYDNKQFNELLTEEEFSQIMDDIDNKLTSIKESYYYQSPFFTVLKKTYNFYTLCKDILKENNKYILKTLKVTNIDFHRKYYDEEGDVEDEEEEEEGDVEDEEGEEEGEDDKNK